MKVQFDWDVGNRQKCQKHGVSIENIEELFRGPVTVFDDPTHSLNEQRLKAIGQTAQKRNILVVFTLRNREGQQRIRPVSARYMHQEEIDFYEKQRP
jgi:uncharacterized protein